MGTGAGPLFKILQLEKQLVELRALLHRTKAAKERKSLEQKIKTDQRNLGRLQAVVDLSGVFVQASRIHSNMLGNVGVAISSTSKTRPDADDFVRLEKEILTYLEGKASDAGIELTSMQPPAEGTGANHKLLMYTDAIYNALVLLAAKTTGSTVYYLPNVASTTMGNLSNAQHSALIGYLDSIGQAFAAWGGAKWPAVAAQNADTAAFIAYLKQIAGLPVP